MLKSNLVLGIIYGVLFFGIFFGFLYSKFQDPEEKIVFSYPYEDIYFGGEEISFEGTGGQKNKERFDREFLIASNNLYQAFLYIKRYPLYIPYIEEKLKEYNIHSDFKYLPLAESALRNDIVSHAGAAGIWQFMPDTARRYSLRVDEYIDERYHFEKSTEAAMRYIEDLYAIFGDWALVAAAYNRGENGLKRDMESQEIDNYYDLKLNSETSRYVFRIVAIKYIFASYFENKNFIDSLIGGVYSPQETKKIAILGAVGDLKAWAKENNYTYRDIELLNPWILTHQLPEGSWLIEVQ